MSGGEAAGATRAADGPAAPRFQMLGAAGLVCDGDVCAVPAPAGAAWPGAVSPAGAPDAGPAGEPGDGTRRVAAGG